MRVEEIYKKGKVFLEFRLRHGVYGQRQDGTQMLRIKIPLGMLTARHCEVLADLSEEYADSISHITTRQDVQYHFVDILDTPNIMRRLASCGITTKEAYTGTWTGYKRFATPWICSPPWRDLGLAHWRVANL